jgi:hypothetical protein
MTTQLVNFEDGVKARIKDIVAELIPEERWTALVAKAVEQFEREDLPKLVKAELHTRYKAVIDAEFNKPEWQATWNDAELGASAAVRQIVIEAAPLVLAGLIGGSMQTAMQQLRYAVQSNRQFFQP